MRKGGETFTWRVAFLLHTKKKYTIILTLIIYSRFRWHLIWNGTVSNIVGVRIAIRVRFNRLPDEGLRSFLSLSLSSFYPINAPAYLFSSCPKRESPQTALKRVTDGYKRVSVTLKLYNKRRCCLDAFRAEAQKRTRLLYSPSPGNQIAPSPSWSSYFLIQRSFRVYQPHDYLFKQKRNCCFAYGQKKANNPFPNHRAEPKEEFSLRAAQTPLGPQD